MSSRIPAHGFAALLGLVFICCACGVSEAFPLPVTLAPPAPFPPVLTVAGTTEFVAPGITYGEYTMMTVIGPLQVHVVSVDPSNQSVRLDSVVASDRLISNGETVSSMAIRTGAVAGVNADYFDINNTYQPLGILVRDGTMLRTPSNRATLSFTRRHQVRFSTYRFSGNVQVGDIPLALTGINEFPPQAGASLLTPAFGTLPAASGISLAVLTPLGPVNPFGRYRISSILGNTARSFAGYALALGPAAQEIVGQPTPGDIVSIAWSIDPPMEDVFAAVGGGPFLVRNGTFYEDPDAPAPGERNARIPATGAATQRDGTLLLFEVDGRRPLDSIGLTRPEFASLMRAFGATDGIAFDGGGSSTLVTRRLGDPLATIRNSPSDGTERVVGDGLFVYSDAPHGPPSRLAVRPSAVRIFSGASLRVRSAITDLAGHPLSALSEEWQGHPFPASLGTVSQNGEFTAGRRAQDGILHVQRGTVAANVPVHIVDRVALLHIAPARINIDPGARAQFVAHAFDRSGFSITLPDHLKWRTTSGSINERGEFSAGQSNTVISLVAGGQQASVAIPVGRHEEPLQLGAHWAFSSVPAGNNGSLAFGMPCPECIELRYDFTGGERAAYMNGSIQLPNNAVGLSLDVLGNASHAALRAALFNGIDERVPLTIAKNIDWNGWRRREVFFPPAATPPLRLTTLYVLNALGTAAIHTQGSVTVRDAHVLVAGK